MSVFNSYLLLILSSVQLVVIILSFELLIILLLLKNCGESIISTYLFISGIFLNDKSLNIIFLDMFSFFILYYNLSLAELLLEQLGNLSLLTV